MLKSDILSECARRIGDTNATFISGTLSPIFDFVLLELSAEGCLSLLRKQSSFALNASGVTSANGLSSVDVAAASVLNLAVGRTPERIEKLVVPAWGTQGDIQKSEDLDFEADWLANGTTYTGQPRRWRIYPNISTVQLWPALDSDSATATCLMTWVDSPTTLTDSASITEVQWSDLPTVLAGLYRHGLSFQDETLKDASMAEARWLAGVALMKSRITKQQMMGRPVQIKYRDL